MGWLIWPQAKPLPSIAPDGVVQPTFAGSSKSQSRGLWNEQLTCSTAPTRPPRTQAAAASAWGRHDAVLFTAK